MSSKAKPGIKESEEDLLQESTVAGARLGEAPHGIGGVQSQARRPSVLIVDDSRDIRDYLSKLLEKEFSVTTAIDGRACINKATVAPPDCIVTDINMPHLSGVDTIKLLRRDPRLGEIPIIAMTAYGNWAAAKALEAGATIVMLKPIDPDEILANINTLVRNLTAT